MTDWRRHARLLADQLADAGHLRSPVWHRVFCAVPRHEFVPWFFEQADMFRWTRVDGADPDQRERWLQAVYSNTTLITALVDMTLPAEHGGEVFSIAVSSSTVPGLMAQMLEDLDVHDGHRVLEIGTGTGYHAALLSERLGEHNVCSVDLRPDLIDSARARLTGAGYRPTLATADGVTGLPEHAPFDRIIATCCVRHVPPAWIEQLRPGGLLLTDIEGTLAGGNLAALRRGDAPVVEGRFCAQPAGFMPMQHQLGIESDGTPQRGEDRADRLTELSPQTVHQQDRPFQLVAQLSLPAGTQLRLADSASPPGTRLLAPDGSWCGIAHQPDSDGRFHVTEGGPHRLWRIVEDAHRRYTDLGEPGWERFGVTAGATEQRVWLDRPDGDISWPISLAAQP